MKVLRISWKLTIVFSGRKRSLLTQFRMGVLPLQIHTEHFRGIKYEKQEYISTLCNKTHVLST